MSKTPAFSPTPEQQKKLDAYTQLLLKWNATHNLIGRSTTAEVIHRHIVDSAQLLPHLPTQGKVVDVGSGGGLPGIVLAILSPGVQFTLAERLNKKAAFLSTVKHAIDLNNVFVHAGDCQTLPPATYNMVTARAVAALSELLPLTQPLLAPNGEWLLLKGQAYQAELNAYPPAQNMTIHATPSITEPSGVILRLRPAP